MKLGISLALVAGLLSIPTTAIAGPTESWTVTGPGEISARIELDQGTLTLAADTGQAEVITPSALGLVTDRADLTADLEFVERTDSRVQGSYAMGTGKQSQRSYDQQQSTFTFRSAQDPESRLDLVVRVADDGVAYRYELPEGQAAEVLGEASEFVFPVGTAAWLQQESASYENEHKAYPAAEAPTGRYNLPNLFRVGETYVHVAESDLDSRYSGARLTHEQGSLTYGLALQDEVVAVEGPLSTPWRTMIIGDLAAVTNSTLTDDLAPPSRVDDTSWIKPGTVAWSWLAGYGTLQKSFEGQQEFVDYAALHEWPYVLVDDGWKGTDWMPDLVKYADARGVKIMVWVHWTDLETADERAELLDQLQDLGVVGLKVDFMDNDGQERLGWYDEILADTADRKLMINFHGTLTPRGLQRTWPQVITMEAVRGAEQVGANTPIEHLLTLPYTRNVVGSMDFTPMNFQDDTIPVTDAAKVAMAVLYESGFQSLAGTLEDYRQRPVAEAFLDQVPASWDQTELLAGAPGEEAVIARQSGDRWFVGGMRDASAGTVRLGTSFLGQGSWTVDIVEDRGGELRHRTRRIEAGDEIRIPVENDSGFAMVACPSDGQRDSCYADIDGVPTGVLEVGPSETIDVEAGQGSTIEVTADLSLTSAGRLTDLTVSPQVPDGWTVEGPDLSAASLSEGAHLRGSWTVTIPETAEPGIERIDVTARYHAPNTPATEALTVTRSVDVRIAPPGGTYVSSLPFVSETNGWGPVERDQSNGSQSAEDGKQISIGGKTYDVGLGMHAEAEIELDLAKAYTRFVAAVGVDDEVAGDETAGTVTFEVIGDGVVLASTDVLTIGDAPEALDVDVSGVDRLLLRVTDGGDGKNADHASWVERSCRVRLDGIASG